MVANASLPKAQKKLLSMHVNVQLHLNDISLSPVYILPSGNTVTRAQSLIKFPFHVLKGSITAIIILCKQINVNRVVSAITLTFKLWCYLIQWMSNIQKAINLKKHLPVAMAKKHYIVNQFNLELTSVWDFRLVCIFAYWARSSDLSRSNHSL